MDEAHKLSTGVLDVPIKVKLYPSARAGFSTVRLMDVHDYIQMDKAEERQMSRRRLLNVLVHSVVFMEVIGTRQRCQGLLIASDHTVKKGLYEVDLMRFITLMRMAAEDFPTLTTLTAAEDGTWTVWTGHGQPGRSA